MIFPIVKAKYYAVSFDSALCKDLQEACRVEGIEISRISVEDFMSGSNNNNDCYINLVTRDLYLRAEISDKFDKENVNRFSYVSPYVSDLSGSIQEGSAVWPWTTIISNVKIDKDFICMGHASIGHNSTIGQGTILSPSVVISGSVNLGKFCYLRTRSTILDKISTCDYVDIGAGSLIRKNITTSGRWISTSKGSLEKIGNIGLT